VFVKNLKTPFSKRETRKIREIEEKGRRKEEKLEEN